MYTSHIILDWNLICIFDFAFKRTLTPFCIFFLVIKTYIVNLIQIILIYIRLNIFMCFIFSTYFIIFVQKDFIHCMINDSIFLLLYVKFISGRGIVLVVLGRDAFRVLRTILPQYLALIWWMHGAMDETSGSGSISCIIYLSFSELSITLTHLGVCILRSDFSSHFPAVTSMVGICSVRYFIRRIYYTLINIFCYFHSFKHVNSCFKRNILTIKSLYIRMIDLAVDYTV